MATDSERVRLDALNAPLTQMMRTEGVKHDDGKARWDLLPFDSLDAVACVLAYGANKYADRNWEKGMAWGRLLAAALRHLSAFARGVERDEESGLPHLAHAACCVLMLLALCMRRVGSDDRMAVYPGGESGVGRVSEVSKGWENDEPLKEK